MTALMISILSKNMLIHLVPLSHGSITQPELIDRRTRGESKMKTFRRKKVLCFWTILCLVLVNNGSLTNSSANSNATDSTMFDQIECESLPWLKTILNLEPTAPQFNMELEDIQQPPPAPVRTPAEFEPSQGVIIYWENLYADELDKIFLPLIQHIDRENTIYIGVRSDRKLAEVQSLIKNEGYSFENISFFIYYSNVFWMRDCGPFFVYDSVDCLVAIDPKYYEHLPRSDGIPDFFCQRYCFDCYDLDLKYDGGNFMTDGKGLFASTDYFFVRNSELTPERADSLMKTYFGCERFIVFKVFEEYLPFGHIDMWAKFLNTSTVLVSQVSNPNTVEYTFLENAASIFDTLKTHSGDTFNVLRLPMVRMNRMSRYCTYTNSLILDNQVFLPVYDHPNDSLAIATYQTALPGHEIIPINCQHFSPWSWGAIHCLAREIPESIHSPDVTVHAGSPQGGSTGDIRPITFTIGNPEARTYPYDVTTTNSQGWVLIPDSFELSLRACTDTVLQVMCTIPETAIEGTINTITITATSQSDLLVKGTDTMTITVCEDTKGDANHDCDLDILDALIAINTILELQEPSPNETLRIDCNGPSGTCDGDGNVNILDAIKIVNLILGLDSCP